MMNRRIDGFSMMEMSIALAIAGLVSLAVWQIVPRAIEAGRGADAPAAGKLSVARRALEGYAVAEHRLPCADANGDGREDCGATGEALPWQTLGVDKPATDIRYEPAAALTTRAPAEAHQPTGSGQQRQNTLDYCAALRNAIASNSGGGVRVGSQGPGAEVAFAIAAPGANGRFEGPHRNANGFALPGEAGADGDDRVQSASPAALATRLDCPARLARSNLGGHQAAQSTELGAFSSLYQDFRERAVRVRQTSRQKTITQRAITGVDVLVTGALLAVFTAQTVQGFSERTDDAPATAGEIRATAYNNFLRFAVLGETASRLQMATKDIGAAQTRVSQGRALDGLSGYSSTQRHDDADTKDEEGVLP